MWERSGKTIEISFESSCDWSRVRCGQLGMLPVPDKLEAESEQEMKLAIHFGQIVRTNVLRAIDISQMPEVLFLIVRRWRCKLSETGDE